MMRPPDSATTESGASVSLFTLSSLARSVSVSVAGPSASPTSVFFASLSLSLARRCRNHSQFKCHKRFVCGDCKFEKGSRNTPGGGCCGRARPYVAMELHGRHSAVLRDRGNALSFARRCRRLVVAEGTSDETNKLFPGLNELSCRLRRRRCRLANDPPRAL